MPAASGALKEKDDNLSGEDFREGMTAGADRADEKRRSLKGRPRTSLGNTEARPRWKAIVSPSSLRLPGGPSKTRRAGRRSIVEKAVARRQGARSRPARPRTWPGRKTKLEAAPLVGKLASCTGRDYRAKRAVHRRGRLGRRQRPNRAGTAVSRPSCPCAASPSTPRRSAWTRCWPTRSSAAMITALGTGIDDGL